MFQKEVDVGNLLISEPFIFYNQLIFGNHKSQFDVIIQKSNFSFFVHVYHYLEAKQRYHDYNKTRFSFNIWCKIMAETSKQNF